MENSSIELLEEVIDLYEEEYCCREKISLEINGSQDDSATNFRQFVLENLPLDIISYLQNIFTGDSDADKSDNYSFIEDVYTERILPKYKRSNDNNEELLDEGCCVICERHLRCTSHHVFPRSTHERMLKRNLRTEKELNTTIRVCQQCHKMIHRRFPNDLLAAEYYSVDLLMADGAFHRYARWASKLSDKRTKLVK